MEEKRKGGKGGVREKMREGRREMGGEREEKQKEKERGNLLCFLFFGVNCKCCTL